MARDFDSKDKDKKRNTKSGQIFQNNSIIKVEKEEDFEITDEYKERKYTVTQLKQMEKDGNEDDGIYLGVEMAVEKKKSNFWRNFILLDIAIGAVTSIVLLFMEK